MSRKNPILEEELRIEFMEGTMNLKREGYNPIIFINMLNALGSVNTAKILINKKPLPSGYQELENRKLLEYAVERIILKKKYRVLFEEFEVLKAKSRLKNSKDKKKNI